MLLPLLKTNHTVDPGLVLVKRVLPTGYRAATLAEHRLKKQALEITEKLGRKDPPG